jgi:hypothetical protein
MTRTTEQVLTEQGLLIQPRGKVMDTILNEAFDTDTEEGSKFDLLVSGTYKAEILLAKTAPLKSGRGQAVNITWQVVEGEYERRQVYQLVMPL